MYALKKLDKIVDYQWHQMWDALPKIESFAEDEAFPERTLAASLASKALYFLEEYDDALRLALEAGPRFDINTNSKYVQTMVNKCIDTYTKKRCEMFEKKNSEEQV